MPWKEVTTMSERKRAIAAYVKEGASVTEISRTFGVSRKTVYKWLARYRAEGEPGLADRSRRPQHRPHQTAPEIEAAVVALRQQHPCWGGRKLKRRLEDSGLSGVPAPSTITAILRRYTQLDANESARHRPFQRFEMSHANALWQMDFKGVLGMDQQMCYPLTLIDDHSRYVVGLHACGDMRRATVQQQLTAVFRRYGLPERMLMDNGAPWGAWPRGRYTRLTVWLLRLGIVVSHGKPYHPETQGKVERVHRTLDDELLTRVHGTSLTDWQHHFDRWVSTYNHLRPHEALDLDVPASRFQPSPRPFPETLPPLRYPEGAALRKVSSTGQVSIRHQAFRVGKAFAGYHLALVADPLTDGRFHLYFGSLCVHTVDVRVH